MSGRRWRGRRSRLAARAGARRASGRAARAPRRSSPRARTASRTARRTRARTSRRRAARGARRSTSIPSASASAASPRRRCSGASRRASATVQSTGGSGHSSAARSNAWRSTRASKRGVVRDEHAPAHLLRELGQHALRRRRGVDHRLRDPGEALDAARQRLRHADERAPALVQLATADEHGADLGQLAGVAREPVRLRVDREELRGEQGKIGERGHEPLFLRPAPDGLHVLVRTGMFICVPRGRVYGWIAVVTCERRRLWRRRGLRQRSASPGADQRDRRHHQLPRERLAAALRRRPDRARRSPTSPPPPRR